VLPEANHNQVVALDGPFAGASRTPAGDDDFFRDRGEDPDEDSRMSLVLLRDLDEHPQAARRAEVSAELARERDVPVLSLSAEGDSALERLASLIGVADYTSAYLALLLGIDPTPVDAITALKERISR
jgi:glucose/mannose-6-phosphate isomerase